MRNIFFVIVLSALTFAGCSNSSTSDATHEHGDGGTHTHNNDEIHQNNEAIQQREFTVDPDSVVQKQEHQDHKSDSILIQL